MGRGLVTDCGPDKVLCADNKCHADCSELTGAVGVSGTFARERFTDCGPDKVLCADGKCHSDCGGMGMDIELGNAGSCNGGIEPPKPDPGP